jgi:hypothetical protein
MVPKGNRMSLFALSSLPFRGQLSTHAYVVMGFPSGSAGKENKQI